MKIDIGNQSITLELTEKCLSIAIDWQKSIEIDNFCLQEYQFKNRID